MRGCHLQKLLFCSSASQGLAGLSEMAQREQICKASDLEGSPSVGSKNGSSNGKCPGLCNEFVKGEEEGKELWSVLIQSSQAM